MVLATLMDGFVVSWWSDADRGAGQWYETLLLCLLSRHCYVETPGVVADRKGAPVVSVAVGSEVCVR